MICRVIVVWGLDSDGNLRGKKARKSWFNWMNKNESNRDFEGNGMVDEDNLLVRAIRDDIADVRRTVTREIKRIKRLQREENSRQKDSHHESDEIGKRLLFLFQCDLLPGDLLYWSLQHFYMQSSSDHFHCSTSYDRHSRKDIVEQEQSR